MIATATFALGSLALHLAALPSPPQEPTSDPKSPQTVWTKTLNAPSFGGAAVADIDGDGRLEVAFGTYFGDNSVRVLNGEDGTEYWRFDAKNACLDASLRFADLDGDGDLELVVPVSNLGWVLAFDAKTGDERWNYKTTPIQCTDTPPAILDVDKDGKLDVTYGTFHGKLHVIQGATGMRQRVYSVGRYFVQTGPAIRDLDGDGTNDIVCATFKGDNKVHAISGKTGNLLWSFQVEGKHIGMYHGPSTGDLDADGNVEMVIGAYDGRVHCLRARDGENLWSTDTPDRYIMSPTAIADLDGDGKREVIVASQFLSVIEPDGKIRFSKPCVKPGVNDSVTRGVSIADLDGDGTLDLASLSGCGLFRVFHGKTGALLYEFDAAQLTKQRLHGSSHGVTIADLTGDGKLDVFFVVGATRPKHGLAVCLTGFSGSGRGWYMLRHDPQNTGNIETDLDPTLLRHIEGLTPAANAVATPSRAPKTRSVPPAPRPPSRPVAGARRNLSLVYREGKSRGIGRAAIDAADRKGDLSRFGKEGYRAVCLLIEMGFGGTWTLAQFQKSWRPGFESELLALCEKKTLPNFGLWSALTGLGASDTKAVRTYLLRRVKTERDAGLFMSIAQALGHLHEERGIADVGAQLLKFEHRWDGVEPHLLNSLANMGAKTALPWFVKYVEAEKATRFGYALGPIARSNPELAKKLAREVLDSRADLSAKQKRKLQQYAR